MKTLFRLMVVPAFMLLLSTPVSAQDASCVDRAQTQKELDRCGQELSALQEQAYDEFKRLAKKFKGNDEMQEMLRQAQHYWKGVHNFQCMLEGAAGVGGTIRKPAVPFEADKAFQQCIDRIARQIHAALVKL